jgi:hypothetical protein
MWLRYHIRDFSWLSYAPAMAASDKAHKLVGHRRRARRANVGVIAGILPVASGDLAAIGNSGASRKAANSTQHEKGMLSCPEQQQG